MRIRLTGTRLTKTKASKHMGTNFYWIAEDKQSATLPTGEIIEPEFDSMDPVWHIGKRSAAGLYCWDCKTTLCEGGESAIHMSTHDFSEQCPKCGKGRGEGDTTPAYIELGFSKSRTEKPSGVKGCSSFSWAQDPEKVRQTCERRLDDEIIEDEYGHKMTGRDFLLMLASNCPVELTHSIGMNFC